MRIGRPRGTPTVRAALVLRGSTRDFHAQVGVDVHRKYEESFSAIISEGVRNHRAREDGWQTPDACAKLTFAPPSGSIKVAKGVPGQLGAVRSTRSSNPPGSTPSSTTQPRAGLP